MYFPVSNDYINDLTDWEILSAHMYLRLMIEKTTIEGQEEYQVFLECFSGDTESLDAWLYRSTKLFKDEFNKRHTN